MPTTLQRDRFDDVRDDLSRVGAHRAPEPRGRGLLTFLWAVLATCVLVGAGIVAMHLIETKVQDTGAGVTSTTPAVTATTDAAMQVVVLNATTTNGLAASAKTALVADGWNVVSTANASSTSVKQTVVVYSESGQAGAALGLAKSLGFTHTVLNAKYAVSGQSRLTVLLGQDYAQR